MRFQCILRKIFILLIFFGSVKSWSQINTGTAAGNGNNFSVKPCGTEMMANYAQWRNTVIPIQNLVSTLKHDTCLNKKFSIVFYIVQDTTPGLIVNPPWIAAYTATAITPAINILNAAFSRICVKFESCSTVVIPNFEYTNWMQNPVEAAVTPNWYTTRTINIYLVNTVNNQPTTGGYTYMPGTPGNKDLFVIRKTSLANAPLLLHLFGHFFGLPDTYAEIAPVPPAVPGPPPGITSHEWFNRVPSNCYTHGDGFCDTEADPYTGNIAQGYNDLIPPVPPCFYTYLIQDGMSKWYTPPVDNYMTEYRGSCRCRYTQEQYNFMARVILTQKLYLH